ncbi:MAG: hypothetical protein AAF726_16040 [Planctomycetota bacterium]
MPTFSWDLAAWMDRYRDVATALIAACAVLAALHLAISAARRPRWTPTRRPGRLSTALALFVVAVALGLGTTALLGLWTGEGKLHGWPLFVHVGLGGAFLVGFALLALVRAGASRPGRAEVYGRLARTGFWLLLVSGLAVGGSMMVATLPWLGGASMELTIELHRWAGLALVLSVIAYGHGLLLGRLARR